MTEDKNNANGQTSLAITPLDRLHGSLRELSRTLVEEMVNSHNTEELYAGRNTDEQWGRIRDQLDSMHQLVELRLHLGGMLALRGTDLNAVMRASLASPPKPPTVTPQAWVALGAGAGPVTPGTYDSDVVPTDRVVSHRIVDGRSVVVDEGVAARYGHRGVPQTDPPRREPVRGSRPPSQFGQDASPAPAPSPEPPVQTNASIVRSNAPTPPPGLSIPVDDPATDEGLIRDRLIEAANQVAASRIAQTALDEMVTVDVVAKHLKMSHNGVYKLAREDKIPSIEVGRLRRFILADVVAALNPKTVAHKWVAIAAPRNANAVTQPGLFLRFKATLERDLSLIVEADQSQCESWTEDLVFFVPKSVIGPLSEIGGEGDEGYLVVTKWWALKAGLNFEVVS